MPRTKNNIAAKKRHKKILSMAKGYRLGRGSLFKTAKDQVEKSLLYAYRDRRQKKRNFRSLWISRINAACRLNGISYSKFMHKLKEHNVELDRKTLAHIVMHEPHTFEQIVQQVTQ
jgi:large subunit ribosomal protein L20